MHECAIFDYRAFARHVEMTVAVSCTIVLSPVCIDEMAAALEKQGVVLETGSVFFIGHNAPKNHFRLGYASIPVDKIEPGILMIADYLYGRNPGQRHNVSPLGGV